MSDVRLEPGWLKRDIESASRRVDELKGRADKAMRFQKLADEYERDAMSGYAYDSVRKDGSHVNPNAERSRQTALLLREAAAALPPLRAGDREEIAQLIDSVAFVKLAAIAELEKSGKNSLTISERAKWQSRINDALRIADAILSPPAVQGEWREPHTFACLNESCPLGGIKLIVVDIEPPAPPVAEPKPDHERD